MPDFGHTVDDRGRELAALLRTAFAAWSVGIGWPISSARHRRWQAAASRRARTVAEAPVRMLNDGNSYQEGIARALQRFPEAMLLQTPPDDPYDDALAVGAAGATPAAGSSGQGGILRPYPDVDHGCLLLLQFTSAAAMAVFPERPARHLGGRRPVLGIATNIGLTVDGLRVAGLSEDERNSLPDEFCARGRNSARACSAISAEPSPALAFAGVKLHLGINAWTSAKTIRRRGSTWLPFMPVPVRSIADGSDTAAARPC